MATTMVRVTEETKEVLKRISADCGDPLGVVLAKAVDDYRRKVFLEGAAKDYERLRADPIAWTDYLEEQRLLEGTLMDGLENEEPYPGRDLAGRIQSSPRA